MKEKEAEKVILLGREPRPPRRRKTSSPQTRV